MKPSCPYGYTEEDLDVIFSDGEKEEFYKWMRGQTISICDGKEYDHSTKEYKPTGHSHGLIYYVHDVIRFLRGLPVID